MFKIKRKDYGYMTRRLQIRIIAAFVLLVGGSLGYFGYNNYMNKVELTPETNAYVKSVSYNASQNSALFSIRWKEDMKSDSVKDPNNYLIEHVFPVKGKWLTAVNGKKCKIDTINHSQDPLATDKSKKVTQVSVYIDPKEDVSDYFRLRVKNVSTRDGRIIPNVEYGVIQITNFDKFTKQ